MTTPQFPPPTQPTQSFQLPPARVRSRLPKISIVLIVVSILAPVLIVGGIATWILYPHYGPPRASDTPPDPGFSGFDVCSLISPADAMRVGARSTGPQKVLVTGRVVRTSRAGVPIDTCEYGVDPDPDARVTVSISPRAFDLGDFAESTGTREPMLGVGGDEAYLVTPASGVVKAFVRRGSTQLLIEAHRWSGGEDPDDPDDPEKLQEHQDLVVELAHQAAKSVPRKLTLPGVVAKGACAGVDAKALAGSLDGPVTNSRSVDTDDFTVCSYASAAGRMITLRLVRQADAGDVAVAEIGDRITIGDRSADRSVDSISFVAGESVLTFSLGEVDGLPRVPVAADLTAAGAAADALLGS